MGITEVTNEFETELFKKLGIKCEGAYLLELGNQHIMFKCRYKAAKDYYRGLGIKHYSIDLNGKDDSLKFDLDYPIPESMKGLFDVVTDYGTAEHVNNQYSLFKNVHDACKVNGIIIHIIPHISSVHKNERYYYSEEFFNSLAKNCGYEIIQMKVYKDPNTEENPCVMIRVVLRKSNKPFVSEEVFDSIEGRKDTGDLSFTGNYESNKFKMLGFYLGVLKKRLIKKLKATKGDKQ